MKRIPWFLAGVLAGALLMYGALAYHLVRAQDGWHLIRKQRAELKDLYVDIRQFTLTDWRDHPSLGTAVAQAGHVAWLTDSAQESLRQTTNQLWDQVRPPDEVSR